MAPLHTICKIILDVKSCCACEQRPAGPVSRPLAEAHWDAQSRASSAAFSVATAATNATAATAATAPAAAYGNGGGGGGRMRMMLPSPASRPGSRPPSRPASVAGDFRRGNYDSPSSRFTPHRPQRGSASVGAATARTPMNRCLEQPH